MSYLLAVVGALVTVVAYPPFGVWPLVFVGPTLWLVGLRRLDRSWPAMRNGLIFGITYFSGLMWWMSELGWEAVIAFVLFQALYPTLLAWLLVRWGRRVADGWWWVAAAGMWAGVEWVRYRWPVGGVEWGAWGYALSDLSWARGEARWMGTSGLTVMVMAACAGLVTLGRSRTAAVPVAIAALALVGGGLAAPLPAGEPVRVAVVQGSTPCPYADCENERFGTYLQHLELTRTIEAGTVDLVVWSEGSTGSSSADPVNNPEVGVAIGAEAARLGAWMVVGGDRPVSETAWINANVVFAPTGEIVGEYRKRHPVPFGEYIPARPLFEWIPALDQVPRDMIPGEGAQLFDVGEYRLGTVISFEGGFARYARQTADAGAALLVVATNEGSYGYTPASDQFIGMTRMRSAETGLDLVHAAVTGKSVLVSNGGQLGPKTGLATSEVLTGVVSARPGLRTLYVRWGEWVTVVAIIGAAVVLARSRPRPVSGA